MYIKLPNTAIGQILGLIVVILFIISTAQSEPSTDGSLTIDNRKILYHQANKDRLLVQQTTKKFISMSDQYEKCISIIATDDSCKKSIEDLQIQLKNVLELYSKTVTPSTTPQPQSIINPEVDVTIQNNIFFPRPTPTRIIIPYQPPNTKPKNSFTPKPGFIPENRFQAGDGFNN